MSRERFIATGLKDAIDAQGRRYQWIADQIGVSGGYISLIMYRQRPIDRQRAEKLASILGVPMDSIFSAYERDGNVSDAG